MIIVEKNKYYGFYLHISIIIVTFAPEKWNRFRMVPIISIY